MSVFLVLILIYLFMKTLTSGRSLYWFLFSFVLVLNAFTDYLPNLMIIVFWVYAIFSQRQKSWWRKYILAHVPIFVLALLWMPYLSKQIQLGLAVKDEGSLWWNVLGRTDIKNLLLVPVKFVLGRISFVNKVFYFTLSACVLSAYTLIIYKAKRRFVSNKYFLLIILWLLIPLTLSAIIGFKVSVFSYFRLIFILPAFLIILALSISNLSKRWQVLCTLFVFSLSILSSLYYLITPRFHREDWRDLVSYIQKESEDYSYKVIFASNGQTEGFRYYADSEGVIAKSNEISSNLEKLWYIRYVQDVFDPGDLVRDRIESVGYKRNNVYDFNGIIVWEYENLN